MLTKVRAFSIFKDSDTEDLCSGDDVDSMTKEIFSTFSVCKLPKYFLVLKSMALVEKSGRSEW